MQTLSNDALPRAIVDHIAAYDAHDIDALMATLSPGALVNDIRREFVGHAAIRAWAEAEIIAPKVTLAFEEAFGWPFGALVRFRVDGAFDKTNLPDPLILTYYFALEDGRISLLVIVNNQTAAA